MTCEQHAYTVGAAYKASGAVVGPSFAEQLEARGEATA